MTFEIFIVMLIIVFVLMVVLMVMHWRISVKLRCLDVGRAYDLGVAPSAFGVRSYRLTKYLLRPGRTIRGLESLSSTYRWLNYLYFAALTALFLLFLSLLKASS
jgi:hypothetical protein